MVRIKVRNGRENMKNSIVLWLMMIGLVPLEAFAMDDDNSRATLRGLTEISVVVDKLSDEAANAGLSQEQLSGLMESKLAAARIQVGPSTGVSLFLKVTVILPDPKSRSYAYHISMELYQTVSLVRDSTVTVVTPTWSLGQLGTVGKAQIVQTVESAVSDFADQFTGAFYSVNAPPVPTQ